MKKGKIIDERGFLFGKISVVDILAVALVIALGLMLYVRFFAGDGTEGSVSSTGKVQVEYVVKISGARGWHRDTLQPGDQVYAGELGPLVGTVKAVNAEPASTLITYQDGHIASVPLEEYYDIYLTMTAESTVSAGGYYLGGSIELTKNTVLQITTLYDSMAGVVVSVG